MAGILVIEDNQATRNNIVDLLRENGHNVYSADNGLSGLGMARQLIPDLIISDIMMPQMDGIEMFNELLKTPATEDIPVIFLTARSEPGDIRLGMKLGAEDYITKPFRAMELLEVVDVRLKKRVMRESKFKSAAENLSLALSNGHTAAEEHRLNKSVNAILSLSIDNISLDELLKRALMHILNLPWLSLQSSGCIFLKERKGNSLIMKAQNNLNKLLLEQCAVLPIGKCLCGLAAQYKKCLYVPKVDDRHSITYPEMPPHGHLCIPIMNQEELFGIINIYVKENHEVSLQEDEFFRIISGYLALVIQKKYAEEDLSKLSGAIEQSADHVIITDRSGNIEYVNKAFEELTGFAEEDWTGKTPRILKSGMHESAEYKNLWDTITCGKVHRGVTINRKKNGGFYFEEKTITPIKDNEGKVTHFVSTGRDITERIKAEEELRIAKEKAERSERLKSEFLAQMSHEIRTPVNSILNFTSLLKYELMDKVPDELKSCFNYIDSGGRRLIRTIDLILNMSQIQSGLLEIRPSRIDLSKEILPEIIDEFTLAAREKNLQLNFEVKSNPALIEADIYTTTQIFVNLIDNAIKFTAEGKINVIVSDKDGYIVADVIDSGIGMSEDFLKHIFEPFSQEETGYTRRFEGNGLGLALAKKYAEVNDAFLKVESEKGKGSRFTLFFRKYQPE